MSKYPKTPDGHHFIVNGRKWRATDPTIPDKLEAQLVSVLMTARRDVGKAKRNQDATLEKDARARVSDAKHALGERGAVWWEPYDDASLRKRIKATTITLLRHRAPEKSICPSEVARVVGTPENWQEIMPTTREVAASLAEGNLLVITRGEQVLDPQELGKGPIRFRRGNLFV